MKNESMALIHLEDIHENDYPDKIRQHWNFTFSRQRKMSVYAKRILVLVIAQIKPTDTELKPIYYIPVKDLAELSGGTSKNLYNRVRHAVTEELAKVVWDFKDIEGDGWHIRHLIDTTQQTRVGYKNGIVSIVLNPALKDFFIKTSQWSEFELESYLKYTSWYSMRFHELLSAWKDTGELYCTVEKYREFMDLLPYKAKDKLVTPYPNFNDLVKKTFNIAAQEFKGTRLEFSDDSPRYIYARTEGRGRPKVTALSFKLKYHIPVKVPKYWKNDPQRRQLLEEFKSLSFSEKLVCEILYYIPLQNIYDTLHYLEANNKKNNTKYCAGAFHKRIKDIKEDVEKVTERNAAKSQQIAPGTQQDANEAQATEDQPQINDLPTGAKFHDIPIKDIKANAKQSKMSVTQYLKSTNRKYEKTEDKKHYRFYTN